VGEGSQLCLTQPGLRNAFLAKLVNYIDTSRAAAKAAGAPPPLVFSVSQNEVLRCFRWSRWVGLGHDA